MPRASVILKSVEVRFPQKKDHEENEKQAVVYSPGSIPDLPFCHKMLGGTGQIEEKREGSRL